MKKYISKIKPIFRMIRVLIGVFLILFSIYALIARPYPVTKELDVYTNKVDAKELERHVFMMSETLAPRDVNHSDNLRKTGKYIKKELEKYSKDVSTQVFFYGKDRYFNVIAKMGNLESKDIIVVGAHYDGYSALPGADDNASGVAGVIELARLLDKENLNKQIHLVAYTLEEPPFFATKYMGSFIHANSLNLENVKMMLSLEMIGYYSDEPNSQSYPIKGLEYMYPSKGNFIAIVDKFKNNNAIHLKKVINKYTNIPAYSINSPDQLPGITQSDHRSYWELGIPALMVTNTAYLRNQNYHTKEDTYDKLDYERMKEVVFGVYLYLKKVDKGEIVVK